MTVGEYKCRTCGDSCDATPQCDQCRADEEAERRGLQRNVEVLAERRVRAERQRDALAEALSRIASGPGYGSGWSYLATWCQDQAREALNAAGMRA